MDQNANDNIIPNKTKIDHYIIESHIGHGGYGEIYTVYDENHKGPWAMKVEMKNAKKHGLTEEIHYLKVLRGSPMFPEFICSGETSELKYFIMELLGPSVSAVRRSLPDSRYKQLTATILAKEMLKCIEELHKKGYVHRDIKPGNFLIRPNRQNPIVLIDFGLSRRFADKETGKPLPPRHNPGFIGTCSFASLNAHEGKELGRRDDIFSWIYTVIEMVDKRLPWPGSKDREKTYRLKQQIRPYTLCGSLPRAFTTIYIKTLGYSFESKPEYQTFYNSLDKAILELGGYGKPFDWELTPEAISKISPIPLDMGPLPEQSESEQTYSKENNKRKPSVDQNSKNDENQQENQKKERKKSKKTSITTNATNETNLENKKQTHINKKEESEPEDDDNKISQYEKDSDNKSDESSRQKLKTAPPREPQNIKEKPRKSNTIYKNNDLDIKQEDSEKQNQDSENLYRSKSEPESQSDDKPDIDEVQTKNVSGNEANVEEPQDAANTNLENGKNDKKKKDKKKKAKSDDEPGCKACSIA